MKPMKIEWFVLGMVILVVFFGWLFWQMNEYYTPKDFIEIEGEVIMDNSLQGERFKLDDTDFRGTVDTMVVKADIFYSKEKPENWLNTTVETLVLVAPVEDGRYQLKVPKLPGYYYQIVYIAYFPSPGMIELERNFTYFGATAPEIPPAEEVRGPTFLIGWT